MSGKENTTRFLESEVRRQVAAFLGGYSAAIIDHVGVVFLTECLVRRLMARAGGSFSAVEDLVLEGNRNAMYEVALDIFEGILENACGAFINGHHMAQDLCEHMSKNLTGKPGEEEDGH